MLNNGLSLDSCWGGEFGATFCGPGTKLPKKNEGNIAGRFSRGSSGQLD